MISSESFFDVLKSKRESQNIEISEICEFTKIHPQYIESIEKGDFTLLPNVYIRLFLRSYTKFIGADSAKALKDYELYTTGKITQNEEPANKDIENKLPSQSQSQSNTEMDSNSQIAPKQIISGIGVIFFILILLWWASKITQEQTENIESNGPKTGVQEESVQKTKNGTSKPKSNFPEPSSKSIFNKAMNTAIEKQSEVLPDKSPLNNTDFLPENKDHEITKIVKLYPPYSISIITLKETKLNVSKTVNAKITELINQTVPIGQEFNFYFTSTINFEFWSNSQVSVKLNAISIDKYLKNSDMAIRGSYEVKKSQLYLSFYKR